MGCVREGQLIKLNPARDERKRNKHGLCKRNFPDKKEKKTPK